MMMIFLPFFTLPSVNTAVGNAPAYWRELLVIQLLIRRVVVQSSRNSAVLGETSRYPERRSRRWWINTKMRQV